MSRVVPEWIGKTADSAIPARVRARVFEAHGGRCHKTGLTIGAVHALCNAVLWQHHGE